MLTIHGGLPRSRRGFDLRLESALRGGRVPGELAMVALMRWGPFSYETLCAMPAQWVTDCFTWMEKEGALAREREALREALRGR